VIGRRLLVVEDDPDVQALMVNALRAEGAEVLTASGVQDAFQAEGRFDVLILDLRLPNGDGREIAQHFRGIPAIYVTGSDQDLGKFGPLPPEDVLPKPFNMRELLLIAREKMAPR
jgi:DNA-binding response OmpR family regulator